MDDKKLARMNDPAAMRAQAEVLTAELYGLDRKIAEYLAKESDEMAEKSLLAFYQCAWNEFEADTFIPNWHHTAMCEALEALFKNEISNLIIQISPGSSKSSLTSVSFPVWSWIHDPSTRFITSSSTDKLALRDPVRSRRLINSEWFQSKWGDRFNLLPDTNRQSKYENDKFGYRIGTTPTGAATGERYEIFICDDPHKALEAYSQSSKDRVWQWYSETMSTRGGRSPRQCIMHQRLAEDDLIGRILANEDLNKWEVLNITMEYEKTKYLWTSTNILPNRDPRTKEGELMWPSKYNLDYVNDKKKVLGDRGYSAQFRQTPVGKEGGIVKKNYLRFYSFVTKQLLISSMDYLIGSWDLTFGDTGDSYCVGQVWGRKGPDKYLIDQYRGKWDFPNQVRFMRQMREDYPQIRGVLVEKKANGDALISTLKKEVPGLVPVNLREIGGGDKMVRLMACITEFEAGNIYIPDRKYYAWVDEFINELTLFPVGKNDDQVDACTQALNYLALKSQTIQRYQSSEAELTKFININKERGLLSNKVQPSFRMQNSINDLRNLFN